jgi:DNA-binding NtrC family response regulator
MEAVREQIASYADLPWHVRIEGPSGSGKELAARELHRLSHITRGPFVSCRVNALADGLEASELAGHARGSFTGAVSDRVGLVEGAHGGILFVDEVATASPKTQLMLLQLADGTVQRVGECRERRIQVRMVFATNADLEALVKSGGFRSDLYYRMGCLIVRMPGLRDHREDIPEIARTILERKAQEARRECPKLPRTVVDRMMAYDWPGNVRQLEHVLECYIADGRLPDIVRRPGRDPTEWQGKMNEVLERHDGNVSEAARELDISRKTFYKGLKRISR